MPSPQLVPASLPSPPPFARRVSSRSRLHLPANLNEPPIPPRLVGSPLLEKLTNTQPSSTITPRAQQQLWFDGDEFGTRRSGPPQLSSPLASRPLFHGLFARQYFTRSGFTARASPLPLSRI
ncbi:hypothetical protein BN946_scf184908.g55 [Trametes cinnabarina]|uniref:Uncharacterized protein n=1 Tax=Pycnoporus cinnabarinus TaxID=5643 RepID=A0A060SFZ7_PYCCI|nr:hypothetical protein BN946_scf184908.g55 [Trametes cinnabarina]